MGKKYIIELEEPEMFDDQKYYQCSKMPWWSVSENIVENLTPYTEPDLEQVKADAYNDGYKAGRETEKVRQKIRQPDIEQIRKEAYAEGYKEGMQLSIDDAKLKKEYQRGLSDSWDAARKISSMDSATRREIFGLVIASNIFDENTASEAIEKLKAYEQEQDEIKVGDEVITASGKAVVIGVGPVHCEYIYADGYTDFNKVKKLKKTGRHFPEIAAVLEKMMEGE